MSGAGGQIQVNSADLVAHVIQIDAIGDGLETARQAGEAVRTDSGAYGQLCQFVPALLNGLHNNLVDGIRTASTSAHDTANALRSVAAGYDTTGRNAADRLRNTR